MNKKKSTEPVKAAAAAHTSGKALAGKPAATTVTPGERQLKAWEHATQLFRQRKFSEACEAFRDVAAGPAAHIADKARSYIQICDRQTSVPSLDLHTAEDHFNYGVARFNARDISEAATHLERALALQPEGDHIFYTLALCRGFSGDADGACENLKRAISLNPRNRVLARQDPDFAPLASQFPGLRTLLGDDGY